jgi:hypothetical protein
MLPGVTYVTMRLDVTPVPPGAGPKKPANEDSGGADETQKKQNKSGPPKPGPTPPKKKP